MKELVKTEIENKIHNIREQQVMLDRDLAELYGVTTGNLNKAVKRNIERFPDSFMFKLTKDESLLFQSGIPNDSLRFQNGIIETGRGRHSKYLPYVFTEQGVAMLSGVLRSDTAVRVSIQIVKTFVAMRNYIATNAGVFQRLGIVEKKQLEHDKKFELVFRSMENKKIPNEKIFFNGQMFDAHKFVSDLIRTAKKSIVLVDNYIDDRTLTMFCKRKQGVSVRIYTKDIPKQLRLDVDKFNSQYPTIELVKFKNAHDRFMIIDRKDVYHIGTSIKDSGSKWCAISKFEKDAIILLDRLDQ